MGVIGSINLRMSADPSGFRKGVKSAQTSIQGLSGSVLKTSTLIKGAFAAAVGGAGALAIGKMVTAASDLTENVGKISAVFGEQGKSVEGDARKMADAFGVSLNRMLDGAGKLGGLFKGAGFSADATADLSKQFNRLTLDASRFFNVDYDTAFQKIRSGLAGEAEPLRDFGVFLTADKVKAQALSMGLVKLNEDLTDQAKITATAAIISAGLADAQGNAAATADGAAAKIEEFKGRVENLAATLGQSLAPIAGQVLGGISTGIVAMSNLWTQSRDSVIGWASTTVDSVGVAAESFNLFEIGVGAAANAFQALGVAWKGAQVVVLGGVTVLLEAFGGLGKGLDYLFEKLTGSQSGIGKFFEDLSKRTGKLADEQVEAFKAAWSKPWASNVVSDQFQSARDQLKALKTDVASITKVVPDLNTEAAPKAKKSSNPFGKALLADSSEAASAILRTRYGTTGKDGVAKDTKRSADTLKTIAGYQKRMVDLLANREAGVPEFLAL